jgi:hypothetical protein
MNATMTFSTIVNPKKQFQSDGTTGCGALSCCTSAKACRKAPESGLQLPRASGRTSRFLIPSTAYFQRGVQAPRELGGLGAGLGIRSSATVDAGGQKAMLRRAGGCKQGLTTWR